MSTSRFRLLIVSNDRMAVREIGEILRDQFQVLTASNSAAVAMVRQTSVDAVVVEPCAGGASIEVLQEIKGINPAIRRIVLTGFEDLSAVVAGLHSGAIQRFIQKPVQRAEVLAAVAKLALPPPDARDSTALAG